MKVLGSGPLIPSHSKLTDLAFKRAIEDRARVDPAPSIDKATVEQLQTKDAAPFAWRSALLKEADNMGIQESRQGKSAKDSVY